MAASTDEHVSTTHLLTKSMLSSFEVVEVVPHTQAGSPFSQVGTVDLVTHFSAQAGRRKELRSGLDSAPGEATMKQERYAY
jgi:hypothetical protein